MVCVGGPICVKPPFSSGIDVYAWDSHDHLITTFANQMLVYNVTNSAVTPASGSPYAVQNPISFTIVPAASN